MFCPPVLVVPYLRGIDTPYLSFKLHVAFLAISVVPYLRGIDTNSLHPFKEFVTEDFVVPYLRGIDTF